MKRRCQLFGHKTVRFISGEVAPGFPIIKISCVRCSYTDEISINNLLTYDNDKILPLQVVKNFCEGCKLAFEELEKVKLIYNE